jgi:hypothetical protein
MEGLKSGLTLLEQRAVTRQVAVQYQREVEAFVRFADAMQIPLVKEAEKDLGIARCFNKLFLAGEHRTAEKEC